MSQENFVNNDNGFQRFYDIILATLNKHAPCKIKHARGNQIPLFNKKLSKAIMTIMSTIVIISYKTGVRKIGSSLENKETFLCKEILWKLKWKPVIGNKLFSKTVKSFPSDKIVGKNKIHVTENGELIKRDLEIAEVLNEFFSNIIQNLNITRYSNNKPFIDNIKDSTMKVILKYRNHPSIAAIRNQCRNSDSFSFTDDKKEVEQLILHQDANKVFQSSDIHCEGEHWYF